MRLTQKKIDEVLIGLLGEEGAPLVKELTGKENVSEFDLATRTKKDIKIIRRMLYQLYNHNLVGFTRKKDKQKGWYIYYWTLLPENIRFSYFKAKREQLERLRLRLEEESRELFFSCPDRCVRLNFDQAIGFDFRCPECGKLTVQDNSESMIAEFKQKIKELEGELSELAERRKAKKGQGRELKKKAKARKKAVRKLAPQKKTKAGRKKRT